MQPRLHMQARPNHQARAFSLIELMVTLGIIALLLAILLPALMHASELAKLTACQSNIRQLAQAQFAYVGDHQKHAPLWIHGTGSSNNAILSYLDARLADSKDPQSVLNCPKVGRDEIDTYNTNPSTGVASYGMNPGILSAHWNYDPAKVPSPERYILLAEQPVEQSDWAITSDGMTRISSYLARTNHAWLLQQNHTPERGYRHNKDGGNAAFNDGHVEFLNPLALSLMGVDDSPFRPTVQDPAEQSRWIWWNHTTEGVISGGGCSCGDGDSGPKQVF